MHVVENVNPIIWEDIARSCDYATYFHTPQWSRIISDTYHYRDVTIGFIFLGGQKAALPLMAVGGKFETGFLKSLISGALYVYGGPIAEGELSEQHVAEIVDYLKSKYKIYNRILIRGNPFSARYAPEGYKEVKDKAHITEIFKYKDESELFLAYLNRAKRVKDYLRRAVRANLTISKENSADNYERFYRIYQDSKQYWEQVLTDYPVSLFKNMYQMRSDSNIAFWTINAGQQMIGGELAFYWNDKCQIFLSYYDREYSALGARRVLLHKIFLDCQERGIGICDMRQSGGIKGSEQFKKSMAGREYPFSSWIKDSNLWLFAKRLKSKVLPGNR